MKQSLVIVSLLLCFLATQAFAQTPSSFESLESLLDYAMQTSLSLQSGDIRLQQAKTAKLAALLAIPDPNGSTSATYTNNTQLSVNLFPAEIVGGQKGSFREVQLGVQYNTNANFYADIKLLNLQGWENLKLAKLNIAVTETDNLLVRKTLQEDIAAVYFNIVTLQEQLKATQQNIAAADTLWQIVQQKYQQGIAKPQEVNQAQVSVLNNKENAAQISFVLSQQYLALKLLCDIPENAPLNITEQAQAKPLLTPPTIANNDLLAENSRLKELKALSAFRQSKLAQLPTFSFFFSQTTQQYNTQSTLFDSNVRWIPSSYIGFKLSLSLPNANAVSQIAKAKYDYHLAQKSTMQTNIKANITQQQLAIGYEKAQSQWTTHQKVHELNVESYQKNLNLYNEGLLSLSQTIDSFNAQVNSQYNVISAAIAIQLAKAKIQIHNTVK